MTRRRAPWPAIGARRGATDRGFGAASVVSVRAVGARGGAVPRGGALARGRRSARVFGSRGVGEAERIRPYFQGRCCTVGMVVTCCTQARSRTQGGTRYTALGLPGGAYGQRVAQRYRWWPMTEPSLPSGMVTFLLTDVEGSTRIWEADRRGARMAFGRHDALVAEHLAAFGGGRPKDQGEGDSAFRGVRPGERRDGCAWRSNALCRWRTGQAPL